MKATFEDCMDCPFCLVSKKDRKYANVFCHGLDKVVSQVLIKDVLDKTAKAGLPPNCPYIDKD